MVVHNQEEMGKGSAIPTDPHHTPTFIQPFPQPQKTQKPRRPKKKDTQVPRSSVPSDNVADEAVYKELDNSLVRAATTASSLEAEHSGNIIKTRSKATLNEPSSKGTSSGSGPRGNTLRSGEDSLKLNELMELCTNLQQRVLDLETTKTTQANEIASLKKRVKKLKRRNKSRTHGLKRLYKVGLTARVESFKDEDMFGVNDLDGDEVIVDNVDVVKTAEETRSVVEEVTAVIEKAKLVSAAEETVNAAATTIILLVQFQLSAKPKADKIVIQEPEHGTTTTTPTTIIHVPKPLHDKGKGIMIEEPVVEQVKPMKRLEQMRLDEELAFKLQAEEEEEEEERLAREKAQQIKEASISWDDVHEKRAGEELEQESSKKQKVEEDKEFGELKQCLEIVPDDRDDVTIDATPLSIKSPTIVNYKIYQEGKKSYF
ncbi:hypothetical protein Tco_0748775 [Tanacetum coccineum]|uniref:Uncharacterized protein n=1 Tax=Tanacetum coccineum TaxID=301880 RepID=A0ABQ4YWJ5_9ASTR